MFRSSKLVLLLLLILSMVACIEGDQPGPAQPKEGGADESAVLERESVPLSPTSEPIPEPIATIVPEEAKRTVSYAGVYFSYSPGLIADITTERLSLPGGVNGDVLPPPVLFKLTPKSGTGPPLPTLQVTPVRQKNGLYYAALVEEQRQQVVSLEENLAAGHNETDRQGSGQEEQTFQFVNGTGLRTLSTERGQERYHFDGITNDGRFTIELTFPLPANLEAKTSTVAALDSLLKSLFVDNSAETLNVTTCSDAAEFVESVTIPDGTEIAPGETFVKTWRMRNTGSCTWTDKYSWTFKGGTALTLVDATPIREVAPGEEFDASVTLVAPKDPGTYAGQWQLTGVDQFTGIGPEVYYLVTIPDNEYHGEDNNEEP